MNLRASFDRQIATYINLQLIKLKLQEKNLMFMEINNV